MLTFIVVEPGLESVPVKQNSPYPTSKLESAEATKVTPVPEPGVLSKAESPPPRLNLDQLKKASDSENDEFHSASEGESHNLVSVSPTPKKDGYYFFLSKKNLFFFLVLKN